MSDICKYVNNAYTDANPYEAHAVIQHDDPAVVAAFQAFYPNGRHGLSPVMAAGIYGAGGPTGPYTGLPFIFADTLPNGLDINVPNATQFNSTVIDVCGNRVSYDWAIYMVLAGPATTAPGAPETIRQRRFIEGWEVPSWDAGSGGQLVYNVNRDSSRTPEGMGLAVRDQGQLYTRTVNSYIAGGVSPQGSWERLYLRLRTRPSASWRLWRCYNSSNPAVSGGALFITPSGTIELYNINSASVFTLLGTTSALPLNQFARIDIVFNYNDGAPNQGDVVVFLDSVQQFSAIIPAASGGFGLVGLHTQSELGPNGSGQSIEVDIDDWINAEPPILFNSVDWLSGSHVILMRPNAFDASHSVNWTGDFRSLINDPAQEATSQVTSSTASARMAVVSEYTRLREAGWLQLGVPAFAVHLASSNAGSTDGQLGYSVAGGADVLVTVNQLFSLFNNGMMYNPAGLTDPLADLDPVVLLHTKSPDGNADTTRALLAMAETIGTFGDGDYGATGIIPIPNLGVHNSPYQSPTGQFGMQGAPPFGEVVVEAGTYVGNGLGLDITLNAPPHWINIRRVTGGTGGGNWWSSMIGAHKQWQARNLTPNIMPQVLIDPITAVVTMRIAGADSENNASGATYQYVCVSDAAMRFMYNGCFQRPNSLTAGINPLYHETFYAQAAYVIQEYPTQIGAGEAGYYKGVGHLPARISPISGAEVSNALTFGNGSLTSQQPPFHLQATSVVYSLWRIFEGPGNGGPGTEGCDPEDPDPGRLVALASYVGNGVDPRNIPLALNGRRPLFAAVFPHGTGGAVMRDPSHTGTESTIWMTGFLRAANGIAGGGIDFITVSTALNGAGVVYDVFALPGDVGGSGWGTNGTFSPVPPGPPCGPWPPEPPPPEPPTPPGSGCPIGDFPTELA